MSLPTVHSMVDLAKALSIYHPDIDKKNEFWRLDLGDGVIVTLAHGEFRISKHGEIVETASPKTAVATVSKYV